MVSYETQQRKAEDQRNWLRDLGGCNNYKKISGLNTLVEPRFGFSLFFC